MPELPDTQRPLTGTTPITARELARLIGVSQSAVSRAFTPGASISRPLRERILSSADSLNYRPNAIASILSKRRSNVVGIILPDLQNPFFPNFLEKILQGLDRAGQQGLVLTCPPGGNYEEQLDELVQYNIDTVVIASARVSPTTALNWSRNGRAAILFNRPVPNVAVASISCGNNVGARQIADHFHELGHRKVAYVAGSADMPANIQRQQAFITRVAELGMTLTACVEGGSYGYEIGLASAEEVVKSGAEAVFFANDITALGGIDAMRDTLGIRVPEDISVAGFDDIAMANWPRYQLTTIRQPLDDMIDLAVDLLMKRSAGQALTPVMHAVEGDLIVRNTTRKTNSAPS